MRTVAEWLDAARQHGSLGAAALHWQAHERGEDPSVPLALMHGRLRVMRESAQAGLSPTPVSYTHLLRQNRFGQGCRHRL